ncbi:Lung seven transmembrane receptor family protein [Zostera marina]|uniref:Lung seven transmembrane receptor family protein n=1 Tax=Zostera marina TaxID=29655 RepID=A0A0K9Q5C8_ZOSMR|nr:Lung seven transmembrane receptor family protein [Zostera marina]
MVRSKILILFVLFLSLFFFASNAEIKDLKIASDPRSLILFEKFGFTHLGHVNISVRKVSVVSSVSPPNHDLIGFFLISDENLLEAAYEAQQQTPQNPNPASFCVLSSPHVYKLFTFKDLKSRRYSKSFPISHPDEYSLFYASCSPEVKVTMSVRTAMYNLQERDGKPDFLSVGQTKLPSLYLFFALVYIISFGFWVYLCGFKNRSSMHRIHALMGALLITKGLNLLFEAEDQHYIKSTGTPHGWDVLFYLFQFLRGVLFFTVIVLIGTGWSFLKPFLQDREKKVLMVVIPLQVLANIASVVTGETGPFIQDWVTWQQVFLLVDITCCCAIMFPIVWSIRTLKETSKTDGKAARNLAKLTLFRQFYGVVVGYLYFTRIVVFALQTIAAYKYRWVSVMASEVASTAFYAYMFYMFRPTERNQYFAIDDEDEEAAQVALQEEDFEL